MDETTTNIEGKFCVLATHKFNYKPNPQRIPPGAHKDSRAHMVTWQQGFSLKISRLARTKYLENEDIKQRQEDKSTKTNNPAETQANRRID